MNLGFGGERQEECLSEQGYCLKNRCLFFVFVFLFYYLVLTWGEVARVDGRRQGDKWDWNAWCKIHRNQ